MSRTGKHVTAAVGFLAVVLPVMFSFSGTLQQVEQNNKKPFPLPAPPPRADIAVSRPDEAELQQRGTDILVEADRESIRRLRLAKEMIAKKQYVEGLDLLQRVLDRETDAFFHPNPEKRDVYQSLRAAAHRVIATMPKPGREAYELKFGQKAAGEMDDALKAGRFDDLTNVTRRYLHTKAGYESLYKIGLYFQDRGDFLAAGLSFDQLRELPEAAKQFEPTLSLSAALCWYRAGMTENARKALAAFRKQNGDGAVMIRGNSVRPFKPTEDGTGWLVDNFGAAQQSRIGEREWIVHRGNLNRDGVAPLPKSADSIAWRLSTIVDPLDEIADIHEKLPTANIKTMTGIVEAVDKANSQSPASSLPAAHPLVVNDTVIVRKLGFIRAIDMKTGKRLWETFPDENVVIRFQTDGDSASAGKSRLLQSLVNQWTWHDLTRGTLSSDSRYLYAIEETEFASPTFDPATGERTIPPGGNRLFAYDLQVTGRCAAVLGGLQSDRKPTDSLTGMFFLGAPLPLAGRLYVLGEADGEVRLIALEHREEGDGRNRRHWLEPVWTQPLVNPTRRITADWSRRVSGASISFADGIMVCCTEAGYVIGVNLASRSLLWAYRYEEQNTFPGPIPLPPQQQIVTWTSHAAIIADGKVILTPQGSGEIHCLKLIDGSVVWKQKRDKFRHVAGVKNGRVFLVGDDSVQALDLADGKPAWKSPAKIAAPSGQGLIAGDRLFVPTKADGIVQLNLADGKQLAKTKLPNDRRPGNLLISGGTMISQSIDSIEAFPIPGLPAKKP